MGCDIHLYVEKKVNGVWTSADVWEKPDEDGDSGVPYESRFYTGRNYNLFAMLADVRNGRGFAGIVTGEGYEPISQPKGMPDDCSPEVKAVSDRWDGDGHSHSHFTLSELLGYDWTQVTNNYGLVPIPKWILFNRSRSRDNPSPTEYCGDAMGGNTLKISREEAKAIYAEAQDAVMKLKDDERVFGSDWTDFMAGFFARKFPDKTLYVSEQWEIAYYQAAGEFISETIPRLLKLAKDNGGFDNVRIVFFFDN